ncbi:MAG: MFS transporter [Candidatus Zixiibacteriota bacterium]
MSAEDPIGTEIKQGLKNSIYDGAFAQIMTVLTSGIFLTGFALLLGGNELHIGILAAIPFVAQLTQLGSSFVIEQKGRRKKTCLAFASVNRYSWLFVFAILLFSKPEHNPISIWILIGASLISYLFGSAGGVAWLSWMADLVPERIRGRYFARRNMILTIVGVLVTLMAGKYLDFWKSSGRDVEVYGFLSLFSIAAACGVISLGFLKKIPGLERPRITEEHRDFWEMARIPLRDRNFLKFVIFSTAWSFSVYMAAPFFAVYMLTDLRMSYGLLALVNIISDVSSVLALPFWGKLSDRFGSKPILSLATLATSLLPILWLLTASQHFVWIIVILQVYGGLFWAGLNLNNNNLLLKLSPKESNSIYLATFATFTGFATAMAPLLGGFLATKLRGVELNLGLGTIWHLHFIFLISGILRLFSRVFLRKIAEPKEKPMGRMIKAIGRLGTISVIKGFEPLQNYFYVLTSRISDFVEKKDGSGTEEKDGRGEEKRNCL